MRRKTHQIKRVDSIKKGKLEKEIEMGIKTGGINKIKAKKKKIRIRNKFWFWLGQCIVSMVWIKK